MMTLIEGSTTSHAQRLQLRYKKLNVFTEKARARGGGAAVVGVRLGGCTAAEVRMRWGSKHRGGQLCCADNLPIPCALHHCMLHAAACPPLPLTYGHACMLPPAPLSP